MKVRKEEYLHPLDGVRSLMESFPFTRELGIRMLDVRRGSCVARIDPSPRLAGNPETGVVHGGVITALLDTAAGAAALTVIGRRQMVATLDLRIDYLRMSDPTRPLLGRAECYRLSRSIAFVRGTAYCDEEKPVAQCAATFMVRSAGVVPT
jgi:uncharacterized protein (TIGR00369 family)